MRYIQIFVGVCWIIFWAYWIVSAFKSKRNANPSNLETFFGLRVGIIGLVVVLSIFFHKLPSIFREQSLGAADVLKVLGLVLFIAGATLAVFARVSLGNNWGMPMTEKRDPELVTSGPYRYVRHPIYTGFLAMAAGSAFVENPYWLLVLIVAAIYFIVSATVEERNLTKQFGSTYIDYKHKTKMLIPFLF